jgi:hypothetical protein
VPRDAREAVRATIAHDRVVASALEQGVTPVPSSLADPYEDDAAMLVDVAAHAPEIEQSLEAIVGKIEMTTIIAMMDAPPAEDSAGRGKAYLEQIRSGPERASVIANRIAESLRKAFPDFRRRSNGSRVAISHLVPVGAEVSYRDAAGALGGDGYRVVIDGPRAPYSFARFSPGSGTILAN